MTLIPYITAQAARDASKATLTDNTGIYNSSTNTGGYSIFVARVAGTISIDNVGKQVVTLANHGLTSNHKIIITAFTFSGGIEEFRLNAIYDIEVLSSSTFYIKSGSNILTFNNTTSPAMDFIQSLSPVNRSKDNIEFSRVFVESIEEGWKKGFDMDSQSSVFFPKSSSTLDITPASLGFTDDVEFDTGIYVVSGYIYYPISVVATVTGNSGKLNIVNSTPYKSVIPISNAHYNPGDNLKGVGDAIYIKVIAAVDSTQVIYTSKVSATDDLLTVLDSLQSLIGGSNIVDILVGYPFETYFLIDKDVQICWTNKVATMDVSKDKACNKACGEDTQYLVDVRKFMIAAREQARQGLYKDANITLRTAARLCNSKKCGC